jgi:glycosyltransferase involved in cell wall biosynthesis
MGTVTLRNLTCCALVPADRRKPLSVLVDAASARHGGGAIYSSEQLRALERIADLRLTIVTTEATREHVRDSCPRASLICWRVQPLPLRLLREQIAIARRSSAYDVVYAPGNFAIVAARQPQVLVLQSLWHFGSRAREIRSRVPERMRLRLAVETIAARASVRKANRVICVSEAMRSCVVEDLGDLEKITVVPPAAPHFPSQAPRAEPSALSPYVLAVGTDLPHKDWTGLIRSFERHPDLPPLVLAGWCAPRRRCELASRSGHGSARALGQVLDRGELADLYRNAACVVAHSHLESYGFTAVEALSLGAPLAASDIPAHRESCGDAAHFYDPADGDALAAAVAAAIHAGKTTSRVPALELTWTENAELTAAALRAAAGDR